MTASRDGGATFLPAVRVSTETSCPSAPGNGRVAESWAAGGDYGSLAAAPDGSFHVVWADSRGGHFQLRHAAFRFEPAAAQGIAPADGDGAAAEHDRGSAGAKEGSGC